MKKFIASLTLLALLSQPLTAFAGSEPSAPVCNQASEEANFFLAPFHKQVQVFIAAYYSGNRAQRALNASRIRKQIFSHPGTPQYIEELEYIDSQAARSPEAVYFLAKALQLHWEARYELTLAGNVQRDRNKPQNLSEKRDGRVHDAAKIGMDIGIAVAIAAMAAVCFFKPQAAPRWFSLIRQAYPVLPAIGLAGGVGVAHAMNGAGYLVPNVPISPAHVMHLGIQTDDYHYDDSTLVRDLAAFTVSAGVGIAVYDLLKAVRVLKYANAAATPAKVNPYAMVISIIVSMVAEEVVVSSIDAYEFWKLSGKVKESRAHLDEAMAQGDGTGVYDGADALVHSAINLSTFINRPLMEAVNEYNESNAISAHDFEQETPQFTDAINENTKIFSDEVHAIMERMDQPADKDYQDSQLLTLLRGHDDESLADLDDSEKSRAEKFRSGFGKWLAQAEEKRRVTMSEGQRESQFDRFIQSLINAQDARLASSLRAGKIQKHPTHVLLQSAALLRSTGKEEIQEQSDYLMTLIANNERMTTTAMTEGDKIVLPPPREPLPEGGVPEPGSSSRGNNL